MRRIAATALSLTLLIGCQSVPTTSGTRCTAPMLEEAQPIPTDVLLRMQGSYLLTTIATSKGIDHSPEESRLTLRPADTLERYYEASIRGQRRTGNRIMVGQNISRRDNGEAVTDSVAMQQNSGNTQMIFGFCSLCFDAQWVYYTITELRPNGFAGRWTDPQTGIGKLVDRNGRELPNPEGYFCADRVS